MPRKILDVVDVKPETTGWTVIAQVVERHPVLLATIDYAPFHKRYRNYLLTDTKGTLFGAVAFENDINYLEKTLMPFKRYKITNARVNPCDKKYKFSNYEYSWTLNKRTLIEPLDEEESPKLPCTFEVCKFSKLYKEADLNTSVAIKALVIHAFPPEEISTDDETSTKTVRDYIVVNEEETPMFLRLWRDLLNAYDHAHEIEALSKGPIQIIAKNLKVSTYHGISLASRSNTYIIQNPPLSEEDDLLIWFSTKKNLLASWLKPTAYKNMSRLLLPPAPFDILDLTTAHKHIDTLKTAWVTSQIKLVDNQTPLSYVACGNCSQMLEVGMDWDDVRCYGCKEIAMLKACARLPVFLFNGETSIRATIYSPDADKLLPFTVVELKQAEDKGEPLTHQVKEALEGKSVTFFFKTFKKSVKGKPVQMFPILKLYTSDELSAVPLQIDENMVEAQTQNNALDIQKSSVHEEHLNVASVEESQLFTPTMKNVLKATCAKNMASSNKQVQSPTAKRTIDFTAESEIIDEEVIEHELAADTLSPCIQSPSKKNKAKQKQS